MKPKQEQIAEMTNAVVRSAVASKTKIDDKVAIKLNEFVENLYKAGYRKASDVIDEFVERLKQKMYYEFTVKLSVCIRRKRHRTLNVR